ncbi:LppP/LprE family lipoprotein [Arcanobacterium haemolyticum]|uniref:LppP/LprE family lipoprotein n=1 Tax=Arcanobacterium haemolyticum TaxID=28264 RepID=UPI000DE5928F|nr:LppP/LprE family lipoprotein [Arcanobacterium haemolyticum]
MKSQKEVIMARFGYARIGCLATALLALNGCSDCASTTGEEALKNASTQIAPAWEGLKDGAVENWDLKAADTSTYDSCAQLSWIVIPTGKPGEDSPYNIALFHNGVFSGTAEARPYLGEPKISRVSDTEIQIERTWYLDEKRSQPKPAVATYKWDDSTSRTVRTGSLPPNEFAAGGPVPTAE